MDPFLARTMVESLSKGFNPVTGLPLSSQDACANEDVQDALLEVLAHCQIESTEQYLIRLKEEKEEKFQNICIEYGKKYSYENEEYLIVPPKDNVTVVAACNGALPDRMFTVRVAPS